MIYPIGTIKMTIPLVIQLLEFVRSSNISSEDVYALTEKISSLTSDFGVLTTDNYKDIIYTIDIVCPIDTGSNICPLD